MLRRLVVLCVAVAAGTAGCGGDDGASAPGPAPTAVPAAIEICGSAGRGWRKLEAPVAAAALGRGPAVVFLNDSTDDMCSWLPLARDLAAAGRTAAVFRYPATTAAGEADATRAALAVARKAGGGRFVLIGASLGGRIVFEAAARAPHGLAGIVSLSGERQIDSYRDILPDVRRVRVPVLYAGAREDSLTAGTRQPEQFRAALPSGDVRFVLVPGFAHGTELLDEARVRRAIDAFLARTLAG